MCILLSFQDYLPNFVDIFSWSYLTDWPEQNFKKLSVSLSLGSIVDTMNNFKYLSSILMEFIEIFNICLSHYFSAVAHLYGDDDDSDSKDYLVK